MSTRRKVPAMQPIEVAKDGVIRFKGNSIVEWLFEAGKIDLNHIYSLYALNGKFTLQDMEQFWQQLGYSVSGFGDLSFASKRTVNRADRIAANLFKETNGTR